MKSTPKQAIEFAKAKIDAILAETKADFIAVSCITCRCIRSGFRIPSINNLAKNDTRYRFSITTSCSPFVWDLIQKRLHLSATFPGTPS